jgi:hypothetical protein
MKAKLLLRIASVIMLLHNVGHTIGHSGWKKAPEPEKQEVIKQMTDHTFPFMGAIHSMADYYDGYGYAGTLALLLFAAILWIASGVNEQNKGIIQKILVATAVILLAWGIDELIFFFPFAASFSFLACLLTVVSIVQINKQEK